MFCRLRLLPVLPLLLLVCFVVTLLLRGAALLPDPLVALGRLASDKLSPPPLPPWLLGPPEDQCPAKENIAFLKTHKCASTAIQNILLRYGEQRHLLFAIPPGNYFGGGKKYVHPDMLKVDLQNRLGFNIYAIHSKWDMSVMPSIMKPNAVFITIVREPSELFVSLFGFTDMERFYNRNISQYIADADVDAPRKAGYVGYNQMTWDFGLPEGQFDNMTAVQELVQEADGLFHLVMVAERMPESLLLLRRLLCADMEDIVVLKVNARKDEMKTNQHLDASTSALLRKRLAADYLLYDHFSSKFERLVQAYGKEQMARDIAEYEHVSLQRQLDCGFIKVGGENLPELPALHKNQVFGYVSESSDPTCAAIIRPEMSYLDLLRGRQTKRVLESLRSRASANNAVNRDGDGRGAPPKLDMPPEMYQRMDRDSIQKLFQQMFAKSRQ